MIRYMKMMHPDTKKAAKDSYLKVLQSSCLPEHTNIDEIADQLTNASSWNDGSNDYSVSICHMAHQSRKAETVTEQTAPQWCLPCNDPDEFSKPIHPVCYPDPYLLRMIPSAKDNIVINDIQRVPNCLAVPASTHTVSKVTLQCA